MRCVFARDGAGDVLRTVRVAVSCVRAARRSARPRALSLIATRPVVPGAIAKLLRATTRGVPARRVRVAGRRAVSFRRPLQLVLPVHASLTIARPPGRAAILDATRLTVPVGAGLAGGGATGVRRRGAHGDA